MISRCVLVSVLCAILGTEGLAAVADWERLNDQTMALINSGRFADGEKNARKELAEAEVLGHKNRISMSLNNLAKALIGVGKPDEAKSVIVRSVKLAKETQAHFLLMSDASLLGQIYFSKRDFGAAELCFRTAIDECGKSPNITPDIQALLYNDLGGALKMQSKLADADQACSRALEIIGATKFTAQMNVCAQNLASVLDLEGKKAEAKSIRKKYGVASE